MRCPSCGKAVIGTRAHGRSRVYRCYTCFTRARYDTARCPASRLDADATEQAIIDGAGQVMVELRGFEPLTYCMPCNRATSCAIAPHCDSFAAVEPS
jgi:hypothetical protein